MSRVLIFALVIAGGCLLPLAAYADPATPEVEVPPADPSLAPDAGGGRRVFLPLIRKGNPLAVTGATYDLIPVPPPPTDRPAAIHGDLNLALRGYQQNSQPRVLVDYTGGTDPGAPQIRGMFSDGRTPNFASTYQVYDWNWACGPNGCRGSLLTTWPVTLLGMSTGPGELIAAPSRPAEIYWGGYTLLVLYAEEHRITLKYTREDNVVTGYTVHLENLDVDSNLLALYRQANSAGRSQLPALKNGQPLGLGSGGEVLVAVRDCGSFLDPRSRKDWWQ